MAISVNEKNLEDITVRLYQAGDESDLVDLCNKTYGIKTNEGYWKWKFEKNPFGNHLTYVALYNGKIIGVAGAIPYRIKVGDQKTICGQLVDLMVYPDWRNRKIFYSIMKESSGAVISGLDGMYGFPNERSFDMYARRFRHEISFRVPRMDKILSVKPILKTCSDRNPLVSISRHILARYRRPMSYFGNRRSIGRKYLVEEIKSFDGRFDDLWKRIENAFYIATVRDSLYLNWRFADHPLYEYKIYAASGERSISGFIVVKIMEEGRLRKGFIVDIFVDPEEKDALSLLLEKSTEYFISGGADLVSCWMPEGSYYYKEFKRSGFINRKPDLRLLSAFYVESLSKDHIRDQKYWYLTMGDCDSF